jgi:MFS family permease
MHPDRVLTRPFILTVVTEFALCLSIGMLLAVIPVYADDELGVGSFGVALAVAAVSPMLLICQPIAGRIGDRRGRRVLVVGGGLIAGVSVVSYTLVDSLELLIVLRMLTGIGEGLLLVGAATIITDLAPERRRGEALSLYSLGLWGGLALGPVVGELALGDDRFDAVWLLAGGCCLAAALIGLSLPETVSRQSHAALGSSTRLVHPAAVGPGLVLALMVFGFAGLATFGALYARELGLGGGGAVFLVYSAVIVATRIVGRRLPDTLGPKRTSSAALVLIAAGLLVIGFWNVPLGLLAGTVVLAFGHALGFPSLMTLAVNAAPAAERSSVIGTFTAFTELGFLIGSLSLGAVASAAGYDGVFVFCAFWPLVGVLVLTRIGSARPAPVLDAA